MWFLLTVHDMVLGLPGCYLETLLYLWNIQMEKPALWEVSFPYERFFHIVNLYNSFHSCSFPTWALILTGAIMRKGWTTGTIQNLIVISTQQLHHINKNRQSLYKDLVYRVSWSLKSSGTTAKNLSVDSHCWYKVLLLMFVRDTITTANWPSSPAVCKVYLILFKCL